MNIEVTINGITPLIMNRFYEAAAEKASSNGGVTMAAGGAADTPRERAQLKLYMHNGEPCIPAENLTRCIYDGGAFFKAGKKQITTKNESMLCAAIAISPVMITVEHPNPWEVDTRPIVIPSTKGRILTHRPRFDEWSISFDVWLDETIVAPKLFRQIVDMAGNRVGLGDFRPARKGPYGRFVVTRWSEASRASFEQATSKVAA